MTGQFMLLMAFLILVFIIQMLIFISRYKRIQPDKLLVVFGKISEDRNEKFKIVVDGATFVWPIFQDYKYIDASPFEIIIEDKFKLKDKHQILMKIKMDCKISSDNVLAKKAVALFYSKEASELFRITKNRIQSTATHYFSQKTELEILENKMALKLELKKLISKELLIFGLELLNISAIEFK